MAIEPIAPDSLAVIALTSRLGMGRDAGVEPLGPVAWGRLRRALEAAGLEPHDLIGRDAASIRSLFGGGDESADRLARLVARVSTLGLEMERLSSRGVWAITVTDDRYPVRLRERLVDSAPPVLYGVGALGLLDAGGVAIVGSRDADDEAVAFARAAARTAVGAGLPVVSGAARGIDSVALGAALESGGSVVGVLADSLQRAVRAPEVRSAVAEERAVFLSPYGADVPFSVGNAMGRNRIIYCLADRALVVATTDGSGGTWAGATEALDAGWVPVLVRFGPGVPQGNVALASRGATTVTSADEVLRGEPGSGRPDTSPITDEPVQQTLFEG